MNIIDIARECGAVGAVDAEDGAELIQFTPAQLIALRDRIRADERERCANVCEDMPIEYLGRFGRYVHTRPEDYAAAIRNSSSGAAPTA